MPPIHPDVKTKDQILGTRPQGWINYAIDAQGRRRQDIIREMHERYPAATRRSLEAAYDHVIAARSAARAQQRLGEGETLPFSQIPKNPNIPLRLLYRIELSWADSITGETRYYTVVLTSSRPMSTNDLISAARNDAASRIDMSNARGFRRYDDIDSDTVVSFRIVSLEKQ